METLRNYPDWRLVIGWLDEDFPKWRVSVEDHSTPTPYELSAVLHYYLDNAISLAIRFAEEYPSREEIVLMDSHVAEQGTY